MTCGPDPLRNNTRLDPMDPVAWFFPEGFANLSGYLGEAYNADPRRTFRGFQPLIGCPGDFILAPRCVCLCVRWWACVRSGGGGACVRSGGGPGLGPFYSRFCHQV